MTACLRKNVFLKRWFSKSALIVKKSDCKKIVVEDADTSNRQKLLPDRGLADLVDVGAVFFDEPTDEASCHRIGESVEKDSHAALLTGEDDKLIDAHFSLVKDGADDVLLAVWTELG